jgi:hypothetical protein
VKAGVNADVLFAEFVEAHASGRRPDVRDYLARAGGEREQLGRLLDRFLSVAPVQEPDEETKVLLNARLEHVTPLTAARTRLPLKVDELVERLRAALGLPESLRPRLKTAYQELEAEQLDPAGVDSRVWDGLRGILGLDARRLLGGAEPPPFAAVAYQRVGGRGLQSMASAVVDRTAENEPDEVDLLFRGPGVP